MSAFTTQDPAVAVAMAHCLTARTLDPGHRVTKSHAFECGWCDYPEREIRKALDEFNAWADFSTKHGTSGQVLIRRFNDLPPAERERQIATAQALGNELWLPPPPEPVALSGERLAKAAAPGLQPPAEAPAPDVEEEIAWLR